MTTTLTLFDLAPLPRWRSTDPDTSRHAAEGVTGRTEQLIVAVFDTCNNLSDDELCARLPDLYPPTVKTARSRLTKAGRLVDSGMRRPSIRGRDQVVWTSVS